MGETLLDEGLLVGGVAEEVALEDGLGTGTFIEGKEGLLGLAEAMELSFELLVARLHMEDGMLLAHLAVGGEGGELSCDAEVLEMYFFVSHLC